MSWVRLDDGFAGHRKVLPLSDAAFRLEVAAICWCNQHANDGHLNAADVRLLCGYLADPGAAKAAVLELVAARLWDVTDTGHKLHDYDKYQPSAAERQASNEAAAERMRKFRERRHGKKESLHPHGQAADGYSVTDGVTVTPSYAVTSREVRSSRPDPGPIPARPDPVLPEELSSSGFPRSAEAAAPLQLALVGDRAKREKAIGAKRVPRAPTEETVAGRLVWSAYEAAYEARYQRLPKRNAWVHADLQKLIKNVGEADAVRIAGYYPTTNHQFYVKNWHAFRFMVTDYEKLLGEIETGRVVTETTARANERTVSNPGLAYVAELEAELAAERAKENG